MFGISETELVLIVLFAFLIFGPDKLPGIGRTIGRALRQFRNAQEGFTEVVQTNIVDPAAEALNDTPKRPNRNREAELEQDADIEAPEGEEGIRPRRAETFAERKQRLAAEKKAREEAEASAAAAEQPSDEDQPAPDPEPEPESEPTDKPKPTVADLYAMTATRSPRTAGADGEGPVASHEVSEAPSAGGDRVSPDATHEVSEARSAEREAIGGDPVASGTDDAADESTTNEKEA